jgi:transposase
MAQMNINDSAVGMLWVTSAKGATMAYRYGQDRNQMILFPQSIDEYIPEDHPVRAYDAFVDALNFAELGIEIDDRKVGNSSYDPRAMLKLLLYGYSYGIKSSRKLERETYHNLAFIWLMKKLQPDHKTIAEFRRNNKAALANTLKLSARLCLKLKLIEGNVLFVDSTKVRANAGKAHQHSRNWYKKQLKALDRRIEGLLAECESIDDQEEDAGSLVKMPKELRKAKSLKAGINAALQELQHRGEKTKQGKPRKVNRIDPDSTLMKATNGTSYPSYAIQSTVDDKNGLIAHVDVVNDANDSNQLTRQIDGAESNLDRNCKIACADAGYSDVEQFEQIETDQRTVVVPSRENHDDPFAKSKFVYDSQQDCYRCPEGHRLAFRRFQDKEHKKRDYRIEKPSICRNCSHFGPCTKSKQGRTVTRHVHEAVKERIEKRLQQPEYQAVYDRRKSRAEHPFGYIKKNLGFGQFSLRGQPGTLAEASILATCFNITRMIRLLGGVRPLLGGLLTV